MSCTGVLATSLNVHAVVGFLSLLFGVSFEEAGETALKYNSVRAFRKQSQMQLSNGLA